MARRPTSLARRAAAGGLIGLAAACRTGATAAQVSRADPNRGRELAASAGCSACHVIPGISAAPNEGEVGPPLATFNRRASIAGVLPNTPDALIGWLRDPQAVKPGDGMPDLGLSETDARDIAAYLAVIH